MGHFQVDRRFLLIGLLTIALAGCSDSGGGSEDVSTLPDTSTYLDYSTNNDTTPGSVAVTLHRARNRLRECLESKGVEGSHAAL